MADEPFTWGSGGTRLTQEEIAQRRKDAAALVAQGTDASPLPAGTRGFGMATQGLARVAKALSGAMDSREADQASKANAEDNKTMIAALLGGGAGAQAAMPAASAAPATADASAPRGIRNNNPLNIEDGDFAKSQPGYAGTDGRFAKFETPEHGTAAASNLLDSYGRRGLNTVGGIVGRWAPASDGNDSTGYAANVAKQLGIAPDAPLTPQQRPALIAAMGKQENGVPIQVASANPSFVPGAPAPSPAVTQIAAALPSSAVPLPMARPAAAPAPVVAASDDEDTPPNATPTQGVLPAGVAKVAGALGAPTAIAPVASGIQNVNPAVLKALTSPYADDATKKIAGLLLTQQMTPKEVHAQTTDKDGNVYDVNRLTGERKVILQGDKATGNQKDFEYGQTHPDFVAQQLAKTKAGAAQLNNQNNIDMNSGQTYDKQLAEGLGKAHASLANGVEDAQTRARDIAAMQGAVDQIQKAGGTTGGMAPAARLELQKSINAGAAALGIDKPFSEADISDKEFLTKFNRSMAGAQAKNAVGSRVTNFEMSNFLKANPGLDMTVTGNQRLLGIQAQIEQRNIAVGNAIRQATAESISNGKKIDPVTVQRIITDYDAAHHIQEPTTGQDLTQSYALPEFQTQGNNAALAGDHGANIGKIRRFNPATGQIE